MLGGLTYTMETVYSFDSTKNWNYQIYTGSLHPERCIALTARVRCEQRVTHVHYCLWPEILESQMWFLIFAWFGQGLAAGLHTIQVRSTDNAGNEQAQPVSYSWTVRSLDEAAASNPPLTNPPETKNGGRFGQGSNQQEESKKNFEDTTLSRLNDAKEAATENLHITIIIVIGVLFLGLACCVMFFRKLQKTRQERQLLSGDSVELGPTRPLSVVNPMTDLHIGNRERSLVLHAALPLGLKRFKYEELRKATGGFPETRVLGEGGFGKVYRGKLQDNTLVAVKRLDKG